MIFEGLKRRLRNKDLPGILYSAAFGIFVAIAIITIYSINGHDMHLVELMKKPVSEIATGQLATIVFIICLLTK